ncbi:hypothetical protein AVEN_84601-1 [Araneus ventricosus]|uniref:Uncharacterized protein n=1 Tax=Araneus ventricosus TaxID=182803 RepID=A0A4Y2C456_ARAVE|nr:hypothetical protein AVEN_84601-1 [Araneus ventricosus]
MSNPYEKEMEHLPKLLAQAETDEVSGFANRPEDILEDNFSDHESFSEHDMESEEHFVLSNRYQITRITPHEAHFSKLLPTPLVGKRYTKMDFACIMPMQMSDLGLETGLEPMTLYRRI